MGFASHPTCRFNKEEKEAIQSRIAGLEQEVAALRAALAQQETILKSVLELARCCTQRDCRQIDTVEPPYRGIKMNVGDIVEIKSGGPIMTVIDVQEEGDRMIVTCSWVSNRKYETQAFPSKALRAVPADDIRLGNR